MTTDELFTRTFSDSGLEILNRSEGGDGRTVAGIAVPYGVVQQITPRLRESFRRGAFNKQLAAANRVIFGREHVKLGGTVIGKATMLRDDERGLYTEFRVSKTPTGDETLELINDGVLTDLSIGFRAGQDHRTADGVIERVTASLFEVSVVLEGAYGDSATITGVRSTTNLDKASEILASLPSSFPLPQI